LQNPIKTWVSGVNADGIAAGATDEAEGAGDFDAVGTAVSANKLASI
jgi:hypothetical protein